jgi:Putative Actinobacterial Holin-X, holin superfamily III
MRVPPPAEPKLTDLLERLVEETGQLLKAEAKIAEAKLTARLRQSAMPLGMLVVAVVLALSALIAVVAALVVLIAPLTGLFLALLIVAALAAAGAFALYRWGRDELREIFAMPAIKQDLKDLVP